MACFYIEEAIIQIIPRSLPHCRVYHRSLFVLMEITIRAGQGCIWIRTIKKKIDLTKSARCAELRWTTISAKFSLLKESSILVTSLLLFSNPKARKVFFKMKISLSKQTLFNFVVVLYRWKFPQKVIKNKSLPHLACKSRRLLGFSFLSDTKAKASASKSQYPPSSGEKTLLLLLSFFCRSSIYPWKYCFE